MWRGFGPDHTECSLNSTSHHRQRRTLCYLLTKDVGLQVRLTRSQQQDFPGFEIMVPNLLY